MPFSGKDTIAGATLDKSDKSQTFARPQFTLIEDWLYGGQIHTGPIMNWGSRSRRE